MSTKILVVKIGTNVLSLKDGTIDNATMQNIANQIVKLKSEYKVVLISSGAMGFGRSLLGKKKVEREKVEERQMLAAVGQVELIQKYSMFFAEHEICVAQVLATKIDFSNRQHYLNMQRCFMTLLANDILPIVNENDTVSVSELMFTDNDELASLVATMLKADKLIILTNVDGFFNGDPNKFESKVINEIKVSDKVEDYVVSSRSDFGRGGMHTKLNMALRLAKMGISVHLANGKKPEILLQIINGEKVGTNFIPQKIKSNIKRFLGFSENWAQAKVFVNRGFEEILVSSKVVSLLPVGITKFEGDFKKGDLVKIISEDKKELGIGKAEYAACDLSDRIGKKGEKAFIHYDYLFIK